MPILAQPLRLFILPILALFLALAAFPIAAQSEAADPAAAEASGDPQQALVQLIEVLRDDAAREALIAELEASLPAEGTEAPAEAAEANPSDELRSIGGQIADFTRGAVENVASSVTRLWRQLADTPRIFAGLDIAQLDALWAILANVAILAAITYGGLIVLRRLIVGPRRRLQALYSQGRWIAKPVALILELLLDLLAAAIPYAIGYVIAVSLLGEPGEISLAHSLYLNAFLMIEVVLSVLRTIVSPNLPDQRLVHLSDSEARSVMGWSRLLVSLFAFGQMMILPLLIATVSFAAGRAVSVVLLLLTLLLAAAAVLVAREPVRHKLMRMIENREARRGLSLSIRYWHVFALIYIAILAVVALTRSSAQFQAYLWSNAQIGIVVLAGFIVLNIIKRIMGNGVTLPESLRRRSPELQRQINAVVPVVLKVVRFIVIAIVVLVCLHGLGFFNFVDFLESEFGARVAGSTVTILMILAVAIIAWIALNAWVDGQVNPELAPAATSRKRTLFSLMRNALTIAIIVITLMFVLSERRHRCIWCARTTRRGTRPRRLGRQRPSKPSLGAIGARMASRARTCPTRTPGPTRTSRLRVRRDSLPPLREGSGRRRHDGRERGYRTRRAGRRQRPGPGFRYVAAICREADARRWRRNDRHPQGGGSGVRGIRENPAAARLRPGAWPYGQAGYRRWTGP